MFMLPSQRVQDEVRDHALLSDEAAAHRSQLIEEILKVNHSALASFLESFDERALEVYARRLRCLEQPRGRTARWVRPDDAPAIAMCESAE